MGLRSHVHGPIDLQLDELIDQERPAQDRPVHDAALHAAGVNEAIHSLLMMRLAFICASANIERLDPAATGIDIVRERWQA